MHSILIVEDDMNINGLLKEALEKEKNKSGERNKAMTEKLEEFATYNDSLEEVFENKEQIEVSKFYEKLPKPHALAVQEWLDGKIYHRDANK